MKNGKRVFIIHGWASWPSDCWFPWLAKELEERSFLVSLPEVPNPKEPNIEKWVRTIKEACGTPDENTFFVGHSFGCFGILKFIESLSEGSRIGGIVLVGGRLVRDGFPKINYEKIKTIAPRITAILSDNDYHVPLSENEIYERELSAHVMVLHDRGHFSRKEDITELPEARNALLSMV